MKIAVAYNGGALGIRRYKFPTVAEDFASQPTTHTSETSLLLILDALREQGHEIALLVEPTEGRADTHFPVCNVNHAHDTKDSALLVFLTQGIRFCAKHGLMSRQWRRVVGWLDAPGCDDLLGADFARFDAIAWATRETLAGARAKHLTARAELAEYAMDLLSAPRLPPTKPRGLYVGRLPREYREPLAVASLASPFLAHLLWADTPNDKILLRPSQIESGWQERIAGLLPLNVEIKTAVNIAAHVPEIASAAFGFAPAARFGQQVASASKWWTYIALGLPVVTADNVPESFHVRENPDLGYLFDQRDEYSIRLATETALHDSTSPDFAERRARIQAWGFGSHTYAHRARTIGAMIEGAK